MYLYWFRYSERTFSCVRRPDEDTHRRLYANLVPLHSHKKYNQWKAHPSGSRMRWEMFNQKKCLLSHCKISLYVLLESLIINNRTSRAFHVTLHHLELFRWFLCEDHNHSYFIPAAIEIHTSSIRTYIEITNLISK